jgi:hypothetical protein
MSAREQEAKIALYQQKLQEFDAGAGGDAYDGESFVTEILEGNQVLTESGGRNDSSDDESSSSSEEE